MIRVLTANRLATHHATLLLCSDRQHRSETLLSRQTFSSVRTHSDVEDDSQEMIEHRLRQANLFGLAGFVSAIDARNSQLPGKDWGNRVYL